MVIPIIPIVVAVILLILLFWVLQQIPLPEPIGKIIMIVVVVLVVLWIVSLLTGFGSPNLRVGSLDPFDWATSLVHSETFWIGMAGAGLARLFGWWS